MSLLYDLAGGSACRRGPCDLHCISPLISLWLPHLSSLVRQSDLSSRPVHTWIKLRSVYSLWGITWDKILKRNRKYTYRLSRTAAIMGWQYWFYPLLHVCEKDSGGLFHCVLSLTSSYSPLFIYSGRHWHTHTHKPLTDYHKPQPLKIPPAFLEKGKQVAVSSYSS